VQAIAEFRMHDHDAGDDHDADADADHHTANRSQKRQ
jgi:hypothetical protein